MIRQGRFTGAVLFFLTHNTMLIKSITNDTGVIYENIFVQDILYIESQGENCMIHLLSGKQVATRSTTKAIHTLFPSLLQPLITYLVNPAHIESLYHAERQRVWLKFRNGEKLLFTKSDVFYSSFFLALSSNNVGAEGLDD